MRPSQTHRRYGAQGEKSPKKQEDAAATTFFLNQSLSRIAEIVSNRSEVCCEKLKKFATWPSVLLGLQTGCAQKAKTLEKHLTPLVGASGVSEVKPWVFL